jgi:hypothetical protein
VDCFSVNWSGENNWIVPPPRLINAVLKKLNKDRAKGVLIVPVWRSAPFWPVLFPDGGTAHFISEYEVFSCADNVQPGKGRNGVFACRKYQFDMAAILLDFRLS